MGYLVNFCDIWLRQRVAVTRLESFAGNRSSAVGTSRQILVGTVSSCTTDNRFTQPNHHFVLNAKKFDINIKILGYVYI